MGLNNTITLHVLDIYGADVQVDLAALGLPNTRYIVEDLAVDQATYSAQALDPVGGKLTLSLSSGAHRLSIYPGQSPVPMATVTLQEGINGYSGAADSYLDSWNPTAFNGGAQKFKVRSPNTFNGVMRFDLSSVPAQALVTGVRFAALSMYVTGRSNNNVATVDAYPLNRAWNEYQASWLQAANGQNWSQPGGNGVPADRGATPVDSRALDNINYRWGLDLTGAVAGWLASPASNQGLLLRSDDPSVLYDMAGSEYPTVDQRPRLLIVYPLSTPTPTPTNTPTRTPTPTVTPTRTADADRLADADQHTDCHRLADGHTDQHAGDRRHPGRGVARQQPQPGARCGRDGAGRRRCEPAPGQHRGQPDHHRGRRQLRLRQPGGQPELHRDRDRPAVPHLHDDQPGGGAGAAGRVGAR